MKKLFVLSVLAVASVNLLFFTTATGQSPSPSPTAEPSPPPPTPPPLGNGTASVAVSLPGSNWVALRTHDGRFEPVTLNPGDIVTAWLRFPVTFAATRLVAQALDGGAILGDDNPTIGPDGTSSIQVQVGQITGTYRVLLNTNGGSYLLRFEVAAP